MKSLLKIQALGMVGTDSIVKDFNGKKYLSFNLAHNEKFKDSKGVEVEKTTWLSCLYSISESSKMTLLKGTAVYLEGTFSVKLYDNATQKNQIGMNVNVNVLNIVGKIEKYEVAK